MSAISNFILVKNLSGKELTDEKIHDFKRLLLAQGGVIATLFLLDLFIYLHFPYHIQAAEMIYFASLGVYVFLLWDMLRNYTSSRRIVVINFAFIMGVFFIGLIAANPFFPMETTLPYRAVLAFIQICLLGVECTVIYFTLMEFFKKDLGMGMRLWAAACIYLMIGFAFGSAYELVCILELQCLGTDIPLQTMGLMRRFEFSLMILSGMDHPYTNPTGMIFSLGTVEALFGQLYVVVIVARLLMK
jgi:hypothetical protein